MVFSGSVDYPAFAIGSSVTRIRQCDWSLNNWNKNLVPIHMSNYDRIIFYAIVDKSSWFTGLVKQLLKKIARNIIKNWVSTIGISFLMWGISSIIGIAINIFTGTPQEGA